MDVADQTNDTPAGAFRAAVAAVGSQSATAKLLGKTQQAISQRLADNRDCWAEHVLVLEAATGISRHLLRPDIYPLEDAGSVNGAPQ